MREFESQVQYLKYRTLCEVAKHAFDDTLLESIWGIPKSIVPGKKSTMRCCVYKERAILGERVKLAMGGNRKNPNIIETLDIACDECPVSGYDVTAVCRGCIAHRCKEACKSDAIYLIRTRRRISIRTSASNAVSAQRRARITRSFKPSARARAPAMRGRSPWTRKRAL